MLRRISYVLAGCACAAVIIMVSTVLPSYRAVYTAIGEAVTPIPRNVISFSSNGSKPQEPAGMINITVHRNYSTISSSFGTESSTLSRSASPETLATRLPSSVSTGNAAVAVTLTSSSSASQATTISRASENVTFAKLDKAALPFRAALEFLDLVNPIHVVTNLSELSISDLVLVSAASENHIHEFTKILCGSLMQYEGFVSNNTKKVIFYSLTEDITIERMNTLRKECPFVEVLSFPYELFPPHVKDLKKYSFKPLAIALALLQYKAVYWMDTSTNFTNTGKTTMKSYFENARDKHLPFLQCSFAGHQIVSATYPEMYTFLPNNEKFSRENDMREANKLLVIGTPELKRTILYRWVQCALVNECIAPTGCALRCNFLRAEEWSSGKYGNCHRFDQSALSLVAGYYYGYQLEKYYIPCDQWKTTRIT